MWVIAKHLKKPENSLQSKFIFLELQNASKLSSVLSRKANMIFKRTLKNFHLRWQGRQIWFLKALENVGTCFLERIANKKVSIRYVFTEAGACLKKTYCVRRQRFKKASAWL
ncbi:MAG: hypothetical protein IJV50_08850 [Lachnospiraceae bacterium]|nr:hypothetical protein [Lachnospiraceae bacterium]